MPNFSFIDLLRGGAAFWVLAAHCSIWSGYRAAWIPSPKIAVDLFMLISGFLMMRIAYAGDQRGGFLQTSRIRDFYIARFFRIAPAYYFSLFLVIALQDLYLGGYAALRAADATAWGRDTVYDPAVVEYSLTNVLVHVGFVFGLLPQYAFSTFLPDWSLSLEMQFYAAFPLVYALLLRRGWRKGLLLLGAACVVFALGYYGLNKLHRLPAWLIFPEPSLLLMKLPYFLAGMALFSWLQQTDPVLRGRLLVVAFALSCWEVSYRVSLLILPCLVLLFVALAEHERRAAAHSPGGAAWLRSRGVQFLSDCSYGVYLFHGFFIATLGWLLLRTGWAGPAGTAQFFGALLILVIIGSYLWAWLVHEWIEQPGIRLGRRWSTRASPVGRTGQTG